MTKEEAREILNDWSFWRYDVMGGAFTFPINDEIVYQETTSNSVTQYTFKHVIKIAYNLKDNE
jgi:hypothetical protein